METNDLQTQVFRIGGMTCIHCQNRIEQKLKNTAGIADALVSYETGMASVRYDAAVISFDAITQAVKTLGYSAPEGKAQKQALHIAGVLVLIFAMYMLLRAFSTSSIAAAFPMAQSGMGYAMLFVIGVLTSFHCIAMCGGINLSQTLIREQCTKNKEQDTENSGHNFGKGPSLLSAAFLYNGGRLMCYTIVGIVVGAVGRVVTLSGRFQGAVQLLVGIVMLIMGITMLGLFPSLRRFIPRMPRLFSEKDNKQKMGKGPLLVGFLNGFMPCGPLQAMQLYALGTGSPLKGGISMFLFCLGTIPLMFALGAAGGILSGSKGQVFSRRVMQVGAVVIAAMGLAMLTNGWSLAGIGSRLDHAAARNAGAAFSAETGNGLQIINSLLLPNRYPAITVQQGVPVRWIISAPPNSINGCNNRMIIREYGIEHTFQPGENIIEFLPARTGRFTYSCWMGMIRSSITVLAEGEMVDAAEPDIMPKAAGVNIPAEVVAWAQLTENSQTVQIRLGDKGFEPAIVVMQKQLYARWDINIDALNTGGGSIIFPDYYAIMETEPGNNPIQLVPVDDFAFSTGDNVFYGYVKVVDDINQVDIEAVKAEVAAYQTLIYPPAYFEAISGGRY